MSWDDQVSAKKSRSLASRVVFVPQAPLLTSLMPHGPNHETAESFFQVKSGSTKLGTYDMTSDYDTLVIYKSDSLPQVSQLVTSDIVTYDITHDSNLQDSEHYIISLFGHFGYLENDAKALASSVLYIACFIQKHPIRSCPIEQFSPILGTGSIM